MASKPSLCDAREGRLRARRGSTPGDGEGAVLLGPCARGARELGSASVGAHLKASLRSTVLSSGPYTCGTTGVIPRDPPA